RAAPRRTPNATPRSTRRRERRPRTLLPEDSMRTRTIILGLALALAPWGVAARGGDDKGGSLFNGRDLTGWEGLIDDYRSVKDGAITGATPKGLKFNTFLCSKKKYGDFEMTFEVRLKDGKGNSGVQIRSKIINAERFAVGGPQADIGEGYWGSLYGEAFGGMMKQSPPALVKKVVKQADFNDYSIRCVGKHVTIKINGETMVDGGLPQRPDEGIIAWQLHAGFKSMEVTFKDIEFKDLSKRSGS